MCWSSFLRGSKRHVANLLSPCPWPAAGRTVSPCLVCSMQTRGLHLAGCYHHYIINVFLVPETRPGE